MTRLAAPLLLLAVLLAGCANDGGAGGPASGEDGSGPAADGPAQTVPGLVGLSGVTIAPPGGWSAIVYDGCSRVPDRSVVFRVARSGACDRPIGRDRSWVTFEALDPDDGILLAMGRGRPLGAEKVRRTGLSCRDTRPQQCDQTVAVPGLGVLVQLHLVGHEAERDLASLRDTLALVDDGFVTVPPVPYGSSDADAVALLESAGLEGEVPTVDWPHYVTETAPPAGSVVPRGSTVALRIGDG